MEKITSVEDLREAILMLELKQANDAQLLKEQFIITCESLKPVTLIKGAFKDLVSAPDFKNDVLDSALSMTAGYISKKLVVGVTHNPLKLLLGAVLQMSVTAIVSKNTDGIKSAAMQLVSKLFPKKEGVEK